MVYEFGKVLAEIDENLIRRDLTPSQRAKLGARRKAAYLEVHPETGNGKAPGAGRGKAPKNAKFAPSHPSWRTPPAQPGGRSDPSKWT